MTTFSRRPILAPDQGLVAGGPAEQFEEHLQALFHQGYRHLLVDLRKSSRIDSRGIRALVRGYTTAHRLGGSFAIVGPAAAVRAMLGVARLDRVFPIYDSVEAAQHRAIAWRRIAIISAATVLCALLVWLGMPPQTVEPGVLEGLTASSPHDAPLWSAPLKLVAAGLVGLLITAFHVPGVQEKPLGRSMQHAQILLAVSGAMMMIIIGSSLARAFGIVGAASIIRFRTPVEDPKDVTILFLLMALGMACGLGAFAVAGFGTAFLCAFLAVLDRSGTLRPQAMSVEITTQGRAFPGTHVESVFARNGIAFETRELSQGKETVVRYLALVDGRASLEDINAQLMADDSGITSVLWEVSKKGF